MARRIEDPEIGGRVGAASGRPLPTERVGGQIGIEECVPKPAGPLLPGDAQILDQKTGHDHAHPVVHPAGLPQLPHPGIDHRISRPPPLPRPQPHRIIHPGKAGVIGPQRLRGGVRKVEEEVRGEFPPADLAQINLRAAHQFLGRPAAGAGPHRMPDSPRRDFAIVEVGTQGTGAGLIGPVARGAIGGNRPTHKLLQPLPGLRFSRPPKAAHAPGPVDLRQKIKLAKRHRSRRCPLGRRQRRQPAGGKHRLRRLGPGQQTAPKRSEHLIGPALLRGHLLWLKQQAPVEALNLQAVSDQRLFDLRVAIDNSRLIAPVPGHMCGRHLAGQCPQGGQARTAPDQQWRTRRSHLPREACKRPMQPPARRSPRLPWCLFPRLPDEDRHHGATGRRGGKRRVVIEPQVVTKPDNRDRGHGLFPSSQEILVPRQCSETEDGSHPGAQERRLGQKADGGGGPWMAFSTAASLDAMPVDRGNPWRFLRTTSWAVFHPEGHGWLFPMKFR